MQCDLPPSLERVIATVDEHVRTLMALVEAMDLRDWHLSGHSERLASLGVMLGMSMRLDEESLRQLYLAGYLHDIGKVAIPDSILLKPGKLSPQEWEVMQTHSARSEQICRYLTALGPVLPAIRHHHERWDGTGYPDGLQGEEIPLLARVIQVVDIYDALINPRPYKPALSSETAIAILKAEMERGWRDPATVRRFLRLHEKGLLPEAYGGSGSMEESFANLHRFVTSRFSAPPGDRISFHPLPPVPAAGFPAEGEGT